MSPTLSWQPLYKKVEESISSGDRVLLLFSPFIKREPLQRLLESCRHTGEIEVVARWRPVDIVNGVSDLEIYPLLKERNIPLHINERLHLKLYIYSSNKGFHTSGNITQSGLGYSEHCNHEIGCEVDLAKSDFNELYKITESSIRVDDDVYNAYKKYLVDNKDKKNDLPKLALPRDESKAYSLSRLPAIKTPADLWRLYDASDSAIGDTELIRRCAHDLFTYRINREDLNREEFELILRRNFKNEKYVTELVSMLKEKESLSFGQVAAWVHDRCADKPMPFRKDVKIYVSALYEWLSAFYEEIEWDVPGAHSQVIYWKKK